MRAVVVGAGVVGLTAAVRLREAGIDADVVARDAPPDTTSAVAAALWYPYRALPAERVIAWSAETYSALAALAQVPGSGVCMLAGTERLAPGAPDPWWREAVPSLERTREGLRFVAPTVDMSVHLPWLVSRLRALGGSVSCRDVGSLDDIEADAVVNCAGLGARELAGDPSLTAVRGQVVRVAAPGVREWLLDQSDPQQLVYVVPRENDVVLGGTADEGAEDRTPDPATTEAVRSAVVRSTIVGSLLGRVSSAVKAAGGVSADNGISMHRGWLIATTADRGHERCDRGPDRLRSDSGGGQGGGTTRGDLSRERDTVRGRTGPDREHGAAGAARHLVTGAGGLDHEVAALERGAVAVLQRAVQHQHQLVAQVLVEVPVRAGREPQQQADGVLVVTVRRPQRVVIDTDATGLDPWRPSQVAQVEPASEYVPDDLDSGHDKLPLVMDEALARWPVNLLEPWLSVIAGHLFGRNCVPLP